MRPAGRGAKCYARRRARRARPRAAPPSLPPPTTCWCPPPNRRWANSNSSSTMPASPETGQPGGPLKDEDWQRVLNVNLTATFRLAQAATADDAQAFRRAVFAITSIVGVTGNPGQGNYAAAKAGMIGNSSAGRRIRHRATSPSTASPPDFIAAMTDAMNDKQREMKFSKVPAARLEHPTSPQPRSISVRTRRTVTGQTIHVNGGMAMF